MMMWACVLLLGCSGTSGSDAGSDVPPDASLPPPFADAQWQVGCATTAASCTPFPPRSVLGEDGVDGSVECSVVETAAGRLFTFRVAGIRDGVRYEASLTDRACVFVEGDERFVGRASQNPPSVTTPCEVATEYGRDPMLDSPTVDIDIRCDLLPNESGTEARSVYFPSSPVMPAAFRFYDCPGQSR